MINIDTYYICSTVQCLCFNYPFVTHIQPCPLPKRVWGHLVTVIDFLLKGILNHTWTYYTLTWTKAVRTVCTDPNTIILTYISPVHLPGCPEQIKLLPLPTSICQCRHFFTRTRELLNIEGSPLLAEAISVCSGRINDIISTNIGADYSILRHLLLQDTTNNFVLSLFFFIFLLLSSIFTISMLAGTFADKLKHKHKDWERKGKERSQLTKFIS